MSMCATEQNGTEKRERDGRVENFEWTSNNRNIHYARALYRGNEPQPKNKVQKNASLSVVLNYLLKIMLIKETKQNSLDLNSFCF